MSFWDTLGRKQLLFKADKPKDKDYKKYVGKTVIIDGKKIVIERIVGNKFKPAFYEINGKYNIGMLRFHAQMLGDTSITEQEFLDFEAIQMEAESLPKPSAIDMPKGKVVH